MKVLESKLDIGDMSTHDLITLMFIKDSKEGLNG
jgi:hypothetical protein